MTETLWLGIPGDVLSLILEKSLCSQQWQSVYSLYYTSHRYMITVRQLFADTMSTVLLSSFKKLLDIANIWWDLTRCSLALVERAAKYDESPSFDEYTEYRYMKAYYRYREKILAERVLSSTKLLQQCGVNMDLRSYEMQVIQNYENQYQSVKSQKSPQRFNVYKGTDLASDLLRCRSDIIKRSP